MVRYDEKVHFGADIVLRLHDDIVAAVNKQIDKNGDCENFNKMLLAAFVMTVESITSDVDRTFEASLSQHLRRQR